MWTMCFLRVLVNVWAICAFLGFLCTCRFTGLLFFKSQTGFNFCILDPRAKTDVENWSYCFSEARNYLFKTTTVDSLVILKERYPRSISLMLYFFSFSQQSLFRINIHMILYFLDQQRTIHGLDLKKKTEFKVFEPSKYDTLSIFSVTVS